MIDEWEHTFYLDNLGKAHLSEKLLIRGRRHMGR